MGFDDVDLLRSPEPINSSDGEHSIAGTSPAGRWRRAFTFLIDFSLFIALGLALTPLLPPQLIWSELRVDGWLAFLSMLGFVLMISYYYFVGSWVVWGRTVGGTIFDTRVLRSDGSSVDWAHASLRWAGLVAGLATLGLGLVMAVLPSRRSLPDILSDSSSVRS